MKVDLERAVEETMILPHMWRAYVDRMTGEVGSFPVEDPEVLDEEAVEEFERLEETGRLVFLPSPNEIGEERVVERYLADLEGRDSEASDQLVRAWRGQPRWRLFKHKLVELGLREEYDEQLSHAMRREIRDLLDIEGLAYE